MDKAVDEMEFASISTPREPAMWCTYRSLFHSDKPYSCVCVVFIQLEKMWEFVLAMLVACMAGMPLAPCQLVGRSIQHFGLGSDISSTTDCSDPMTFQQVDIFEVKY